MSSVEYLLLNIQFDFEYISKRVKLKIILKKFIFMLRVCVFCLPVCICTTCLPSACGSQKGLELAGNCQLPDKGTGN